MNVQPDPNAGGEHKSKVSITSAHPGSGPIRFGAQPPIVNGTELDEKIMLDMDDRNRGPAIVFSMVYDKIVYLRESDFNPTGTTATTASTAPSATVAITNASSKDIEFTSMSATSTTTSNTASAAATNTDHNPAKRQSPDDDDFPPGPPPWIHSNQQGQGHGNGGGPGPGRFSRKSPAQPGDLIWQCTWENTLLEGFIYLTQNATSGPDNPAFASSSVSAGASTSTDIDPSSTSATVTGASSTVTSAVSSATGWPSPIPQFPRVVKIEESQNQKFTKGKPPYCKKMSVNSDYSLVDYVDPSTKAVVSFQLHEFGDGSKRRDAGPETAEWVNLLGRKVLSKRQGGGSSTSCHCAWMNT
jgi:hypothetical protein